MAGELDSMKRLHRVAVDRIEIDAESRIFTVRYGIRAEDDSVMYQEAVTRDRSRDAGMGQETLAQMRAWAIAEAAKDARQKYGRRRGR